MGPVAGDRRDVHDARRSRARCRGNGRQCRSDRDDRSTPGRGRRLGGRQSRDAARERRQSFSAMAGIVVRRARGRPVGRRAQADGCSSPAAHPTTRPPRASSPTRSNAPAASAARIVDAEGWSLEELRAAVDRAALFIGGDSGPLHIAATSRVPIVGLYGPTLPERSAPWRSPRLLTVSVDAGALPCRPCDQRVCVTADFRCLSGIPASHVLREAERLLAEQMTTPSPVSGS